MTKSEKNSLKKGRWLVLDQTSHTKEEILALVRAIDGAEIQIIDTKTYVRFPERRPPKASSFAKIARILRQKRSVYIYRDTERESLRQYCAVMIKNAKK